MLVLEVQLESFFINSHFAKVERLIDLQRLCLLVSKGIKTRTQIRFNSINTGIGQ